MYEDKIEFLEEVYEKLLANNMKSYAKTLGEAIDKIEDGKELVGVYKKVVDEVLSK